MRSTITVLHEFLSSHRPELVERCQRKVGERTAPKVASNVVQHGVALFLDQLIRRLRAEQSQGAASSRRVPGPAGGIKPAHSEIGDAATVHGGELMRRGYTVEQVVHDYGDLCQAITELAVELDFHIQADEFRILNGCLDNAMALAVSEFNYQREFVVRQKQELRLFEQLGSFAHELRNLLTTATLAVTAVKAGHVGLSGATGAVLDRSLVGMQSLIDRTLIDVRLCAGMPTENRVFSLAEFIAEVKVSAMLSAAVKACTLTVADVDSQLGIDADRDLMLAAVANLLDNAFKFTQHGTNVTLTAYARADRVLIDVEDHCGGVDPSVVCAMFVPFTQFAADKAGVGLGLSIARRSVEANRGSLTVQNRPRSGCVFTIDIPRFMLPQETSALMPAA